MAFETIVLTACAFALGYLGFLVYDAAAEQAKQDAEIKTNQETSAGRH